MFKYVKPGNYQLISLPTLPEQKEHTFPVVMFTIWTDPSSEPVTARVESELIAKHVNPAEW